MARRARSSAVARAAASPRPHGEVYRQESPEARLARQRQLVGLRERLEARQQEADARLRPALELIRAGVVAAPTHAHVLARAGMTEGEWKAQRDLVAMDRERQAEVEARFDAEQARARLVGYLDVATRFGGQLLEKRQRQQAGNQQRRVADDGWEEEAAARHRAGEKWAAIAPDYGLGERRCRELVKRAGCTTRGHR